MRRHLLKLVGAMVLGAAVSACGGGDDHDDVGNLVEVAQANNFTALLAAATKAGLADELSASDARLTVFAPTDAAFATLATQLGFADATAMVNALPASALESILSYHVLPSRLNASQLTAGGATQPTLYSFGGGATTLALNTSNGVRITDAALTQATVATPDVPASNGIIHVVDKVLVPPGVLTVVQMAQVNPATFSTLVSAVVDAGLAPTLSGAGPFTVFAPTNAAFAAAGAVAPGDLVAILTYHVLPSQVLSSQIPFGQAVATVEGQDITINAGTAPVIATITDTTATAAQIVAVDVRASNGVIHVIDKVLIPLLTSNN